MKDRSWWGHAAFALLAAVAASAAWQKPWRAEVETDVLIVPGSPERIDAVVWSEPKHVVTLTGGGTFSIEVIKRDDDGAAGEATGFPPNGRVAEVVKGLAPLRGTRSLGKVDAASLKALGLDEPKAHLTLRYGQRAVVLAVGGSAFGSGDLYVRRDDGEVFLLPAARITALRYGATTLLDKNLLDIDRSKIERATISTERRAREVIYSYAEDRTKAFFADPAEPEAKLKATSTWLSKLMELHVESFLDGSPRATQPAVTVAFSSASGPLGTVRLWEADKTGVTASSTRFSRPARLSRGTAVHMLREVDAVLQEDAQTAQR